MFICVVSMNSGDMVVGREGDRNMTYNSPQNFRLNFTYPRQGGFGAELTYVALDIWKVRSYKSIHISSIRS